MSDKTIQQALSELLSALRFDAMARDVLTETDLSRLRRYAQVILRNSAGPDKLRLAALFRLHKPPLY